MKKKEQRHHWKFSRVGGVNRVNLESGQDLLHLRELDQKLWTALSCPVQGLEIDEATLQLIDTDKDNRIRIPNILDVVDWACSMVKDPDVFLQNDKPLDLDSIQTNTPEGVQLLASAKKILQNLGKNEATSISVEDTSDTTAIFAGTKFNGDNIITVASSDDETVKKTIEACITTIGSETDLSGLPGISKELVESFYAEITAYSDWMKAKENDPAISPFADNTEHALQQFLNIKPKIDDYFLRCKLADFDKDSTAILNTLTERLTAINTKDISSCMEEIATYPLAKIEAGKMLSLEKGINPAWEKAIKQFQKEVIESIFPSKKELSEKDWNAISGKFTAHIAWKEKKAGEQVESLGAEAIQAFLAENKKSELLQLIEKDNTLETEANNIFLVNKLTRCKRDLFTLLNNFVTFNNFYAPNEQAIFQAGTLYIDQRSCNLCIRVNDMDKHNLMASQSGMYLLYCDCVSKNGEEKISIVAAVTNGDIDNLMVGRNAIFYDRKGKDWDATITKIIENPISIRQAFFSPYRKLIKFIESQANKLAASKEEQIASEATGKIEQSTSSEAISTAKPSVTPFDIGKFVGIFAAIGMALGALGAVLASFISGFLGLVWWKMPFAILAIILVISGPSMFLAWLKLRNRNLAPVLDANGWAINARALINIRFGNTLTHLAELPKNSHLDLRDPFAKKKPLWLQILYILLILGGITALLWYLGYLPFIDKIIGK